MRLELRTRARLRTAIVCALLAPGTGMAVAADGQDSDAARELRAGSLDEVVVTARKREENLQEVPISLTALGAEQIERRNIANLADLARQTAGFTWSEGLSPLDARPAIRGQSNIRSASQPTVGVFVDGNAVPWRTGLNLQTVDVERIEVVKGPQSALFGRGVLSGAVNYVTRRPQREFGGYVEGSYGQAGREELRARLDLPAGDTLALAVAARWMEADGLWSNALTGRDGVGAEDATSGSVALLFEPTPSFTAYLRASYAEESQSQPAYHTVPANRQTGALPTQRWFVGEVPVNPRLIAFNCDDCGVERDVTWVTANLDWEVLGGTLTSLTAFNRTDVTFDIDTDYTGILDTQLPLNPFFRNGFRAFIGRDVETVSQELRFASDAEARFRWLAGLYWYDEQVDEVGRSVLGTTLTPAQVPAIPQLNEVNAKAVFGSVAFDFTERLTASAELRWNEDEGSVDFVFAGQPRSLDNRWESWLPRVTLDFQLTPDLMLYASGAKGTKPGGFNTALGAGTAQLPANLLPFDEEQAWAYEVGLKSQWLDRRLTLNLAAFRIDWEDVQVDSQFVAPPPQAGVVGYTSNAGKAEVNGAELELRFLASDALELSASYAYTPARLFDYQLSTAAAAGISTLGEKQLPYSSDHTAAASAVYTLPLGPTWSSFAQLDAQYRSTQYATNANLAETGDRTLLDLRLGLTSASWEIVGYVTNLTNDDTPDNVSPFVNPQTGARVFIVAVPDPRLWGVRVRYSF